MSLSNSARRLLRVALCSAPVSKEIADAIDADATSADPLAIRSLASTGLIARTSSSTSAARTITGTTNQITVTNGSGSSGNPLLALAAQPSVTTGYAVNGTKVIGTQQTAVVPVAITYTTGDPSYTTTGALTIANGGTPTVSELLKFALELKANVVALQAVLHAHGITT